MMCNHADCLKEIRFENMKDLINFVPKPQKYKSSTGGDLFGFPSEELYKAALYYSYYAQNLKFEDAQQILSQLKYSMVIEELSLNFRNAFFKDVDTIPFLKGKTNIREIILELYSKFSKKSLEELTELSNKREEMYNQRWKDIVPDEDSVTLDQLGRFYNSLPLPAACNFFDCLENNLSIAFRALPILLAQNYNIRSIFDFGGNSGLLTSAMANWGTPVQCLLIEENQTLMDFAKWRDQLFGIRNVSYLSESAVNDNIGDLKECFEMGICTEVLEHVYDVEGTLSTINKLLKEGGLLYQSVSFRLYPYPSHLKKNTKYIDHEDELMLQHGFEKLNAQFPIPLLGNIGLYRKVASDNYLE